MRNWLSTDTAEVLRDNTSFIKYEGSVGEHIAKGGIFVTRNHLAE